MASKNQKTATKKTSTGTKVTRITASGDTKTAKKPVKKTAEKNTVKKETVSYQNETIRTGIRNPFAALGRYFAGAWYELRQVRWPNRKATWGLTVAVLAFSAFFVVLILLLDALFKYIFQLILG